MLKKEKELSNNNVEVSKELLNYANMSQDDVLNKLNTKLEGLSSNKAGDLIKKYGLNEIAKEKKKSPLMHLLGNLKDPLNILLVVLALISYLTGDIRAMIVILFMVVLGTVLRFFQELRADHAAQKLQAMVSSKATVIRDKKEKEVSLKQLIPGDIIRLGAGDMIPADVRILSAKDLFLNQAPLTGESLPVEKRGDNKKEGSNPFDMENLCFLGSDVISGTAIAVVVHTGERTYFGSLAKSIVAERTQTSFDKGINGFTWLMIKFILIMVPLVFIVNGISKQDWLEAFLFAMAVAVGLTPEMMPMIVSVNLSKGALMMSRKKVIVKRLNSIQNFGAMDVFCTDKTGTITEGKIILEKHLDVRGESSQRALEMAYLNSYFHTGLRNLMDDAVLDHAEKEKLGKAKSLFNKIDEIPFDFNRKRMSVIIEDKTGLNTLICKGAFEEILSCCNRVEIEGKVIPMIPDYEDNIKNMISNLNKEGFRDVAIAYKEMPDAPDVPVYESKDESELILIGFLAFLDPPKKTAPEAIKRLENLGVNIKILTGDNDVVTAYICKEVGLHTSNILLGPQIEKMTETELIEAANGTSVFAKLAPSQKEQIIKALQKNGHVVGFMGDGINDAPALKAADVGISVDSGVDIAKESSDIILLDNNLIVLEEGVVEGRRVFGNIIKYIKMAASSNFGNMFSVVGASAFLPFLPMLPIQVLTNNLLYDFSQTTIPTDTVDEEWLKKPRQWKMDGIQKFIFYIGPISSIFDYLTFFIMLFVFQSWNNPALFHTGWFIESIFTQTLIIHVIRTKKVPFLQSKPSKPLMISSLLIVTIATLLTILPIGDALGFVPLPPLYWVILAVMMMGYIILTQAVKTWFANKFEQ